MNTKPLLILAFATAVLSPVARADITLGISADIRMGRALPPPPPDVVVVEQVGPPGPPPWAQSHWYRRSRAYYYYPGCDVYYRPADHAWFYLKGGSWTVSAQLPTNIRVDLGHAISLSLETDRPYIYHEKVVAYYPADYFSRVKYRNDHDNDRDDDHGRDDDHDDHGRGRGHAKGRH